MQDLLPLAEKLGARLKARGDTIAIAEILDGWADFRGAAFGWRRVSVFPRRERDLYALRTVGLPRHSQSAA